MELAIMVINLGNRLSMVLLVQPDTPPSFPINTANRLCLPLVSVLSVPVPGDLICKVGGPVYRIGLGGGSASSSSSQASLDTSSVQREDPQMEQKMNCLLRACIERDPNPIKTIHDQGAGGNANVLNEIIEETGGHIHLDRLTYGDKTIVPLEAWIAEYQESNAIIISPTDLEWVNSQAKLENVNLDVVGTVTSDKKLTVSY